MNLKSLRNALVRKRRAWVVGLSLTLSLVVVAGAALLVFPRHPVVHADGISCIGLACVAQSVDPAAVLNNTKVDVNFVWKCELPAGAQSSVFVIELQLSQGNSSSSGLYELPAPPCTGAYYVADVAVPSPTGGQPFQAGTAEITGDAIVWYYPDPTMYDLVPISIPILDQILITAPLTFSVSAFSSSTVHAGATIAYKISVKNTGPGTALGVRVLDLLPRNAGLNWTILSSPKVGPWSITNGVLSLSPNNLAAGASDGVIVSSPTTPATCGTVTDSATMTSNNAGTNSVGPVPITVSCP